MDILVKSDLFRVSGKTKNTSLFFWLLKDPCFRYLYFFRKLQRAVKWSPFGLFYYYFFRRYRFKYGIQIPRTVVIGPGFLMPHEGGIVIHRNSVIGKNVTILHGVTLGNTKKGTFEGTPTICDHVYIGPGATIVGNVRIGENCLIAPNSYVNCDVPDNCMVIGNPCEIVPKKEASMEYIVNPWPL